MRTRLLCLFCFFALCCTPLAIHAQQTANIDFDNNGEIEFTDFILFAQAYGSQQTTFDLDQNGTVDFTDFLSFARSFRQSPHYLISFADPVLEATVREAIGKPSGNLEAGDVADLLKLDVQGKVSDLTGIEHLTALEELNILYAYHNPDRDPKDLEAFVSPILDLTPLVQLANLKSLMLYQVRIRDLAPLAQLTSLEALAINHDQHRQSFGGLRTANLSVLKPLIRLESLSIFGLTTESQDLVQLANFSNLRELALDMSGTQDQTLSAFSTLSSLEHLALLGNRIEDLTPLANLTGLKKLYIGQAPFSLISATQNFTDPQTASLGSQTRVSDLSSLSGLTSLTELVLGNSPVQDISPLANLTGLKKLWVLGEYMQDLYVTDLSPLSNLTALEELNLGRNPVSDLAPLANLTALQSLSLDSNRFASLAPLAELTELTELWITNNQITDLSILSNLMSLQTLSIKASKVQELSPLENLASLQRLYLSYNQITDLSGLLNNSSLGEGTEIHLSNNPLSTTAYLNQIPALEERGIRIIR